MNPMLKAMHREYGNCPGHICGECCNFVTHEFNRRYFKCAAYGESHSTATDWRRYGEACGLFGKGVAQFPVIPLVEVLKHRSRKIPEGPLEGQLNFMEGAPL